MRKFCFLAPACVLLFSLQVLAANRADSRSTKAKDDAVTVELFDAIKSGDIEVRVIAKDATAGNVLIKNTTKKPLAIKLPEAFAAVPVAAQFGGGGPFGGGPFGGNPGGGVGLNNGMIGGGGGGGNQAVGGGFQQGQNGMNGFNPGGNGVGNGNGRGLGINNAFPGGLFKVEPEKVGKLNMTSVCLEYGKPDPNAHIEYELRPLDSVVSNPETLEAVKMLARGEIDQKSAQAAAWHLANGLTWEQLEKKVGRKHLTGRIDLFFTSDDLVRGQEVVKEAKKRAESQPASSDDRRVSLAQQK